MLERFEDLLLILDTALNTKEKRHLIGGMLMSVALLFGRPIYNGYYNESRG